MKLKITIIIVITAFGFGFLPLTVNGNTALERWHFGPWQSQGMISWGSEMIVFDFGRNGLWSYNGSWRRLSYWDPNDMLTWGKSNLVVDFGSHGVWTYDTVSWEKIAL